MFSSRRPGLICPPLFNVEGACACNQTSKSHRRPNAIATPSFASINCASAADIQYSGSMLVNFGVASTSAKLSLLALSWRSGGGLACSNLKLVTTLQSDARAAPGHSCSLPMPDDYRKSSASMTESADGASARYYCAAAVGDRVQLHSLKKENFNGRIGHVAAIADGGRFATTLSKAEKLSLKPDNLRPLPTPTIGVAIVGADESAGKELLAHILARRQDILLSRGAFIAVLALVGRDGAVHPQRRERALLTRRGESDAPHGGLSDATLDAAVAQPAGLASCPGYKAAAASAKATHRRLGPARAWRRCVDGRARCSETPSAHVWS